MNSDLTAKHEIEHSTKLLRSAVSAIRSTSQLNTFDRLEISKSKIFSCLTYLVFIFIYGSPAQINEFGRQICLNFKKAAYLHMQVPTNLIESYLFGMDFKTYCALRFFKVAYAMKIDKNHLFDNMYQTGRDGKLKPARGAPIGKFSKKFIETSNNFDYEALLKTSKNFNKKSFSRVIIAENGAINKKFKQARKEKEDERRRQVEQRRTQESQE